MVTPPHPHPHPQRQQKSPARQGANKLEKNTFLIMFYDFVRKDKIVVG